MDMVCYRLNGTRPPNFRLERCTYQVSFPILETWIFERFDDLTISMCR